VIRVPANVAVVSVPIAPPPPKVEVVPAAPAPTTFGSMAIGGGECSPCGSRAIGRRTAGQVWVPAHWINAAVPGITSAGTGRRLASQGATSTMDVWRRASKRCPETLPLGGPTAQGANVMCMHRTVYRISFGQGS
jgi:hypothetical protein